MADTQNHPGGTRKPFGRIRKAYLVLLGFAAAILLLGGYFAVTLLIYPRVLPQPAVHLLADATLPSQGQKVIVFAPHPDDETIGVGGYIALSTNLGANVRVVLVTDGNKHHNEAVRYAEFGKATAILGVNADNLVFMNYPDGTLRQQNETTLQQQLQKQIDDYSPDIIVYPCRYDFHPDHSTTGKIIDKILAARSGSTLAFEYLVHYEFYYPHPKKLAIELYLLPPARLVRFGNNWQKMMLPTAIESLKENATYTYQSQLGNPMLKELLLSSIRANELLMAR